MYAPFTHFPNVSILQNQRQTLEMCFKFDPILSQDSGAMTDFFLDKIDRMGLSSIYVKTLTLIFISVLKLAQAQPTRPARPMSVRNQLLIKYSFFNDRIFAVI